MTPMWSALNVHLQRCNAAMEGEKLSPFGEFSSAGNIGQALLVHTG